MIYKDTSETLAIEAAMKRWDRSDVDMNTKWYAVC